MIHRSAGPEILRLIDLLAKLPGLGPRSARRAALHLLKKRDQLLGPLSAALADAAAKVQPCRRSMVLDPKTSTLLHLFNVQETRMCEK
jgi:recombination protein RecR